MTDTLHFLFPVFHQSYSNVKKRRKALPKTTEKQEKNDSPKSLILAALLLGCIWTAFINPWIQYQYWQSDTFWLIETGRLILQTHSLPLHDTYSYTASSTYWLLYQWLPEVIFAVMDRIGGLAGLAVFGGVLFAILFCVLIFRHMVRREINPILAAAIIIFCAYSFYPAFSSLRPQLFSFIFFWLIVVICDNIRSGLSLRKALISTFFIAFIWANCHISFLAALLVIAGYLIGSLHLLRPRSSEKKIPLSFLAMYATFVFGTLFTPYVGYLWAFVGDVHNRFYTQEVAELDWGAEPHRLAVAIIAVLSAFYLFWRKKIYAGSIIVLLALLFVASNCSRLFAYFCLFSCPIIGNAANELIQPYLKNEVFNRFGHSFKTITLTKYYPAAIALLASIVVLAQPVVLQPNVPVLAARYLADHPVKGHLFSTAHAGSYLIYSSHGTIPVFMDTRVDLYDPDFCFRFIKVLYSAENWKGMFDQFKIAAALLPNDVHIKLNEVLAAEPDWKVEYHDKDFTLFVKKSAP